MLKIVYAATFKKDFKRILKRGKDLSKFIHLVEILQKGESLPPKYRDHALSGNYAGFRDCHIEPDWILVYRIEAEKLHLILFRTGTHSDLF